MILFEDIIDNVEISDEKKSASQAMSLEESNAYDHFDFAIKLTVTKNNEILSDIDV